VTDSRIDRCRYGHRSNRAAKEHDQDLQRRLGLRITFHGSATSCKLSRLSRPETDLEQAVLVYWVTQNVLSIGQAFLLKLPALKRLFGIPERVVPKPETEGMAAPMTFWEGVQAGAAMNEATKAAQTTPAGRVIEHDATPMVRQQVRTSSKKGKQAKNST
jgi:hypothetical protein